MSNVNKIMAILEVIEWMDDKRWLQSESPGNIENSCFKSLSASEQILVHWLCYITDRMRPFEQVWRDGGQVFSEIIKQYKESTYSEMDVVTLFSRLPQVGFMENPKNGGKSMDTFVSRITGKAYAVRYPVDLYSIARTLILLLPYKKDLVSYISQHRSLWDKPDRAGRIAFLLYLVSYSELNETFHSLSDDEGKRFLKKVLQYRRTFQASLENFEEEFERWNKSKRFNNKRLWASLRDYFKFKYFSKFFLTELSLNKNINEELVNLEFPGDVWNQRFAQQLLHPLLSHMKVGRDKVLTVSNASKSIRRLFKWLHAQKQNITGYYPEQFDVSFDFAPRMCENKLCEVCPFGKGALRICYGNEVTPKDKYCPVALVACGYEVACLKESCPIIAEVGSNLCITQHASKPGKNERFPLR